MFELLRSPWFAQFDTLLAGASNSLTLCSPYIGRGPCDRVTKRVFAAGSSKFNLSILTDLSRDNMLSGATDVSALASVLGAWPNTEVRFLPSLHAKVYIADENRAVVTSGNLTDAGLLRNFEYGIALDNTEIIRAIKSDVLHYAALGSPINQKQLSAFAEAVGELREMHKSAERSLRTRLHQELDQRLRAMDNEVLRVRAAGRTAHAIFAETIRYLLQKRPMKTTELNRAIQRIHPDLCDDTVDRVIDGQHFGKKWKHGVRMAQVFLRRRGDIVLEDGLWRLRR